MKNAQAILERADLDADSTWQLSGLFSSKEDWEAAFIEVDDAVSVVKNFRGKLNSASLLADFLVADTTLDRLLDRLHVYAHLRSDEDTRDTNNQGMLARIMARATEISGELAWVVPEILSHEEDELRRWADDPCLAANHYAVIKLLRQKAHTLSDKEEELLMRAGEIFAAPSQVFNMLTNADMQFPSVKDPQGDDLELSEGRFTMFLRNRDRRVRRQAFENLFSIYDGHKNTLAATLAGNVKHHNYVANIRHYESALSAALYADQIPGELYRGLISAVHGALPAYHEYISMRGQVLGLRDLDMFDMYVPLVSGIDLKIPFAEARTWILEACQPLGQAYCDVLATAFTDRWIDIYENRGKRSGAYSSGCYDSLPFVLMNYQGRLEDVFTLAHELGHSMHSWLANHAQPHRFAQYPIFIAEIASTLNEELLLR